MFSKPVKGDLRFRDIINVQIRLICFPFQLCKNHLCWGFLKHIKKRSWLCVLFKMSFELLAFALAIIFSSFYVL